MTYPLITAATASILGILQIGLMMTVGLARRKTGVLLGDAGNPDLLRKIRRHGNLIETAPIFLILLALLELGTGATNTVIGLATLFTIGRFAHAAALSGAPFTFRLMAVMGTVFPIAGTAGWLLYCLAKGSLGQ